MKSGFCAAMYGVSVINESRLSLDRADRLSRIAPSLGCYGRGGERWEPRGAGGRVVDLVPEEEGEVLCSMQEAALADR